jgi:hypothetical protein
LPLFAGQNGLLEAFAANGYNLSELAGAQVISIEGKSPWDYLDQVSGPEGGLYQDPEQRLNYQVASYTSFYGGIGLNPGHFTQTLSFDKDDVKLSVKTVNGQEVDITSPWLTTYRSRNPWSFQSGEELYVSCLVDTVRQTRKLTLSSASMPLACTRLKVRIPAKELAARPTERKLANRPKGLTPPNLIPAPERSMSIR